MTKEEFKQDYLKLTCPSCKRQMRRVRPTVAPMKDAPIRFCIIAECPWCYGLKGVPFGIN